MRLFDWLLLLVAAIVLPLTFQAIFARRRRDVRPSSRHAEHYLTARLAGDRRPGAHDRKGSASGSDVRTGGSPLHETDPGA